MNVIITGASRGIGFELTKLFSHKGSSVLAISRNTSSLEKLELDNVIPLQFDLQEEDYAPIKQKIRQWKSVDIIINNAGFLINKPFQQISDQELNSIYQVNIFSPFRLIRDMMPHLSDDAHIVNITSMGGIQGSAKFPGLSAYSSSKGALTILTECLAQEFSQTNVRFNALALGAVQTQMLKEAFPDFHAQTTSDQMANYIYRFAVLDKELYNGKVLPVSFSTP